MTEAIINFGVFKYLRNAVSRRVPHDWYKLASIISSKLNTIMRIIEYHFKMNSIFFDLVNTEKIINTKGNSS